MKGNLKMAQAFEDAIGRLWDGDLLDDSWEGEVYSCVVVCLQGALEYIEAVEPGLCGRFSAFGIDSSYEAMRGCDLHLGTAISSVNRNKRMQIQMTRALWLTLLAEVAERGEVFGR